MTHPLFAPDHKLEPFWLDDTPGPALGTPDLPGSADVAVVGSGYTGLVAALTLAREGRGVVVFDAEEAGYGCSSRNGGQCGAGLKPGFDGLSARYGKARALAMYREARASLEYLAELVERFATQGLDRVTLRAPVSWLGPGTHSLRVEVESDPPTARRVFDYVVTAP